MAASPLNRQSFSLGDGLRFGSKKETLYQRVIRTQNKLLAASRTQSTPLQHRVRLQSPGHVTPRGALRVHLSPSGAIAPVSINTVLIRPRHRFLPSNPPAALAVDRPARISSAETPARSPPARSPFRRLAFRTAPPADSAATVSLNRSSCASSKWRSARSRSAGRACGTVLLVSMAGLATVRILDRLSTPPDLPPDCAIASSARRRA